MPYTPKTILIGVTRLGDKMPQPEPIENMATTKTPSKYKAQIPAMPGKLKPVDDYSTDYVPPFVTTTGQLYAVECAPPTEKPLQALPAIDDVVIEDGIPMPGSYAGRDWIPLLRKMKPKQCATLPAHASASLNRSITSAHKAKMGWWVKKRIPKDGIVRVWREK